MAKYPRLIHPVPIKIAAVDKAATVYDRDMREQISSVRYGPTKSVPAQVEYAKGLTGNAGSKMQVPTPGGSDLQSEGYLLFLRRQLEAAGIDPSPGDLISEIDGVAAKLYVTMVRRRGHFPQFGWTLLRVYFTDRKPTTR